jgi:hypothetical protein
MRVLADTAVMPYIRSHRTFFRFEISFQDQSLEIKLESTLDLSHSEMRAARGPFFGIGFGRVFALAFLSSSSVAAFLGSNSDSRHGVCFGISRQSREIIAPEARPSHAAFQSIRQDYPSEGERCTKDTVHPIRHHSVHPWIFGRVRSRRSCACHDDQFGRGQNTGLGWSDPTFAHVSVPKVIRGVAPAQLRVDRAAYFARAAFSSRRPQ